MTKRPRVPKGPERLLAACESHLKFLGEALAAYDREPDRYKQLAAELRVLVCKAGRNKPLLLDLMDEYGFVYEVHPIPDLPFPITMVGQLHEEPEVDFSAISPEEIWAHHRARAKPVRLREFIDRALAVYIRPHEFSYRDLILAVAQQIGVSHEDRTMEKALVELEQFLIGGFSGYGAPLRHCAQLVYDAGVRFMGHVASTGPGSTE